MARFMKALSLSMLAAAEANHIVRSDTHWKDTDGKRIEAHAAGMLQSPTDNRWYWYGESVKTDDLSDHGVTCYSAETIAGPWKNEGKVLSQAQILQPDTDGPFVVERPKVLYNAKTKKFVMWFHLDTAGYKYRHAGIAQVDSPAGPFEYVHGMKPDGILSLDMSLFLDPVDQQAYFIRSCDNKYVGISRLTDDYLNSTGVISQHGRFEGMSIFRHANGPYYMMTSHLTGWNPNPLMLFRAAGQTLDDPQWVNMGNPTGSFTSFNSQPTYVVEYTPASGDPYFVYMADDWVHCPNDDGSEGPLLNACYIWLPIQFHESSVTIEWRSAWDLDNPFAPTGCHAGSEFGEGAAVALATCEDGAANQQWQHSGDGEGFSLGDGSLCLDTTGQASQKACSADDGQSFAASGEHFQRASDGKCLDASWCGLHICEDMRLEAWSCNTRHPNQHFAFDSSSGQLTSEASGERLCVTACNTFKVDVDALVV